MSADDDVVVFDEDDDEDVDSGGRAELDPVDEVKPFDEEPSSSRSRPTRSSSS